ncbi:MAG TPA: response regulator [Noviherbaspirillum sp.]|uniref:response regulator n=1 Tax=Noviherbaspirillum sp. TaxID=1926288 RepID=UPI002B4A005A|nr:response regulator [Noviherbaspirillum sp.]HJV85988.1 response regulator [Noviherbaspirillum sp.]
MRLLLAEDEKELANWLCRALKQNGYIVDWVDDGRLVESSVRQVRYDALILDLGLPGMDGHAVLSHLREADERLPVLILTAQDSLLERVSTLKMGADDFMAKPFSVDELEARLTALIRRARGSEHPRMSCGPLSYDALKRQFTLYDAPLALSKREHALLHALLQCSGEPLSKRDIYDKVFEDDVDAAPEAVEVLIYRVRKKLEGSPLQIVTLRGLGYLLELR